VNLRTEKKESPDINLTPLIDVVFLLLIFFMVSTTFKRDAELKIELPEASAKPTQVKTKPLEVVIDAKGRYYLDDKQLVNTRLLTLKQAIEKLARGNMKQPLVIRADANTPHHSVVMAMDAARQLGFVNLSIATVQSKKP
jgi:biopolymer transport protein ExbD